MQGAGARDLGGGEGQRRRSLDFSPSVHIYRVPFCAQLNSVSPRASFWMEKETKEEGYILLNLLRLEGINPLAQGHARVRPETFFLSS